MQRVLDTIKSCYGFAKKHIKIIIPSAFMLVGIVAIVVSMSVSGLTFAYDLSFSDGTIIRVKSIEDFNAAKDIIKKASATDNVDELISEPEFTRTLALSSQISDVNSIAETIVENTDEIVNATILRVNGEYVTCVAGDISLDEYIETALHRFDNKGSGATSKFVDKITTEKAFYPACKVSSIEDAKRVIDTLKVQTVATVSGSFRTSYSTSVIKDSSKTSGYCKTTSVGVAGVTNYTDSVTFVNGVEQSRVRLSSTVVRKPSNEVIIVGTKPLDLGGAKFGWPIARGVNYTITSKLGDDRGHKGFDIAATEGTPVCASLGGVVIEASTGYNGGYGYKVVVDHGNGITTVYAHCSKLLVSVGQRVSTGQVIAKVGNTGRSTGPHLHFEIRVNGNYVDPEPYIGV